MIKDLLNTTYEFPTKRIETIEELKKYNEQLVELMLLHRNRREIAATLMCNELLLDEYASVYYHTTFESLKNAYEERSNALLVGTQFEMALNDKNSKMAIFLGKNYAKQVEDASTLIQLQADNVMIVDDVTSEAKEENVNDNV